LTDPVPNPYDSDATLSPTLCAVIMKMMAKEMSDRFQTMEEVEAALKNELSGGDAAELPAATKSKTSWLVPAIVIAVAAIGGFFAASLLTKSSTAKTEPAVTESSESPAEKPKVAEAPKPPPPPAKPAEPARPPLVIADYTSDSRVNRLGATFGSWGSTRPQPIGRANEHIETSGSDRNGFFWKIDFDITTPKSFSGTWMKLNDLDATGYDTFSMRVRSGSSFTFNFVVELKGRSGPTPIVGRYIIQNVDGEWQTVDIPLKSFGLVSIKSLNEITIVFDEENTGSRKGTLCIDEIQFLKKS